MKTSEKDLLQKQVDVYIHWRRKLGCDEMYEDWLRLFVRACVKVDIMDVTDEDEKSFMEHVQGISRTKYEFNFAEKAIKGLRTYYKARNKNKGRGRGRPPHLDEIALVKKYRKMGLKIREIERLTGKQISLISRWIHFEKKG